MLAAVAVRDTEADDAAPGAVLGDESRGGSGLGEAHDERRRHLVRGSHGGGGDGLDGAHWEGLVVHEVLEGRDVVDVCFSLLADVGHDGDGLDGVVARGGFAGEHDAVGAVEDGVGDVGGLRAGGAGRAGHGLEHLSGGDDELAGFVAALDHALLREEDLLHANLHAEVAARDHDAVGLLHDVGEVVEALHVLNLGDDEDVLGGGAEHLADVLDVGALAHERGGDEVNLVLDAPVEDVVAVLLRDGGKVDVDAGEVHVLALAELGAVLGPHLDGPRVHVAGEHGEGDGAVGAEDLRAGRDILGEGRVGHRDEVLVALALVVGGEGNLGILLEEDGFAVVEHAGANLGSLGVEEDAATNAEIFGRDP